MYFYYFVYFLKENLKKDLVICFCELFIFFEKKLWVWSFFKKLIFEMVNCIKKLEIYDFEKVLFIGIFYMF